MHLVAIGQRIVQPLEQHHRAAFGPHIAIGARIEGVAATTGAEHRSPGEATEGKRAEQHVHAADHRGRDAPQPQRLGGVMQRHQPRRTRRVDGLRRPAQVEDVADPVGDDGERRAGHHVAVGTRRVELPQIAPVGRAGAHVDAQIAPGDGRFRPTRMFERLPHQLQDQALLRVHLRRLARREAEDRVIEAQHIAQHPGGEGVGLARLLPARVQPGGLVEPVGWDLADGVPPPSQQRPEGGQVRRAGQPAGSADHSNRAIGHCRPASQGATPVGGRGGGEAHIWTFIARPVVLLQLQVAGQCPQATPRCRGGGTARGARPPAAPTAGP